MATLEELEEAIEKVDAKLANVTTALKTGNQTRDDLRKLRNELEAAITNYDGKSIVERADELTHSTEKTV